jgi:hypothetical protein
MKNSLYHKVKQGDLVKFESNNQSPAIGIMMDWYNGFRDWDYPPYGDETVIVLWINGKSDYTRRQYLEVVK